jgi:hypothetical protein
MDIEEKRKLVNELAGNRLEELIKEYEEYYSKENFEVTLLAEMYGRMILAHMLGYDLTRLSEDAVGASGKLKELAQGNEE